MSDMGLVMGNHEVIHNQAYEKLLEVQDYSLHGCTLNELSYDKAVCLICVSI